MIHAYCLLALSPIAVATGKTLPLMPARTVDRWMQQIQYLVGNRSNEKRMMFFVWTDPVDVI